MQTQTGSKFRGNVSIDSMELWIPHYEIDGGLDAIEQLFDGHFRSDQFFMSEQDGGVFFISDPTPLASIKSHHPVDKYHGIRITRKKLPLGQKVGQTRDYIEGVTLALGSKHLGDQYLEGICVETWARMLRAISDLTSLTFKSDLSTCRVFSVDIKGDLVIEDGLLVGEAFGSKDRLELELLKLLEHVDQSRFDRSIGKVYRKGKNWGYTVGKRHQSIKNHRRTPYFQIYSKYYQQLNDPLFNQLVIANKIDPLELASVVRMEMRIGSSQLVSEYFGSNQLEYVLQIQNHFLYVAKLRATIRKYLDLDRLPIDTMSQRGKLPVIDLKPAHAAYLKILQDFVEREWNMLMEEFPPGSADRQRIAREFWSQSSIDRMCELCTEKHIAYFCHHSGQTRSDGGGQRAKAIRKHFDIASTHLYRIKESGTVKFQTLPEQMSFDYYDELELNERLVDRLQRIGCYWLSAEFLSQRRALMEFETKRRSRREVSKELASV